MHSKHSLEHGIYEGFAKRGSDKRLIVDQHQQSHVLHVGHLNMENETKKMAPLQSSGLSAPAPATGKSTEQLVPCAKKVADPTKGRK